MILSREQYYDLWNSLKNAHARLGMLEKEARELRELVTPNDPGSLPKESTDR